MNQPFIYMDHAATTPLSEEAWHAMCPYLRDIYGNPSSLHPVGQRAALALREARQVMASLIHAKPSELFFTSGGTESDNWALRGVMDALQKKGKTHLITSKIEHDAILRTCQQLETHGFSVTYLDVNPEGIVDLEQLNHAIRPETGLISIMMANNEVGSIQPVQKIARLAHAHGIYFHTDAVQAFGHMPIDVDALGVDLLSVSGHKFHGPKGVGLLYCRRGTPLTPYLTGGLQEQGRRAGTENVAGIIGMTKAATQAVTRIEDYQACTHTLQEHMLQRILAEIPYVYLNGPVPTSGLRLSNNLNFIFRYTDNEMLLQRLAEHQICCSAGSACESGSVEPSHVLSAMGLEYEQILASIRFSFGEDNTIEEIDHVVDCLKSFVEDLRKQAPEYA